MRRFARAVFWATGALITVLLFASVAGLVLVQTQWFRDYVRNRIVLEVENATGGRTELRQFLFDWHTLTAEVRGFTIHGKETPSEQPLFRAESVRVSLRILSVLRKRIDLHEVAVRRPEANIIVYGDGSTNLPTPRRVRTAKRNIIQTVLDLAIKRFVLAGGTVQFAGHRIPLDVVGENLLAQVNYEAFAAPRYRGGITFRNLAVKPGDLQTLPFDLSVEFALTSQALQIERGRVGMKQSAVDVRGRVLDFANPRAELEFAGRVAAEDLRPVAPVAAAPVRGWAEINGRAAISGRSNYAVSGNLRARGLLFETRRGLRIQDAGITAAVSVRPGKLDFSNVVATALGGRFEGSAGLAELRDLKVDGTARSFSIDKLAAITGVRKPGWTGSASGPVHLTGSIHKGKLERVGIESQVTVAPEPGPNPVEGFIDARYAANGDIDLKKSYLSTPRTRVEFSGAVSRQLQVMLDAKSFRDIELALEMVSGRYQRLPVQLGPGGSARFQGTVKSPLKDQTLEGRVELANFNISGHDVGSFSGVAAASKTNVRVRNLDARKGQMRASGWVQAGLRDWKPDDAEPLAGELSLRAPDLDALIAELNRNLPVTGGAAKADVKLGGTIGSPQASGRLEASKLVAWGQPVAAVETDFRYREGLIEASSGEMQVAGDRVRVSGSYAYPPNAIGEGRLRVDVANSGTQLADVNAVQERSPGLGGRVEAHLAADLTLQKSGFRINAINGTAALRTLTVGKQQLGFFTLEANTKGEQAVLSIEGRLSGAEVNGSAECALSGEYPVRGAIDFRRLDYARLIERVRGMPANEGLPVEGAATGRVEFAGSTTKPETVSGNLRIAEFEMRAEPGVVAVPNAERIVLRNAGPMLVDFNAKTAQIRQAVLRGPKTDLTLGGRVSFVSKNPFDLRIRGEANLAVLEDFKPKLESSGTMLLDISVRGRPSRPDIYGRVDVKDAAFNWPGLPNGIDRANGLLFIYRDRASIDSLTAETGGGRIRLNGFIGFGTDPTFHMAAKAEGVRVRYPEGVSSSADANLTLSGTTARSMLSGEITVTRVGFNPRSDLATILASTAEPVQTPAEPNRLLQGMQMNVHIVTSPQARLETKLTKDIQADADLRLRGSPLRPIVLGRVLVKQGEVLFFGNQYEIQSGQILFVNASKIEPIANLDLQTQARSIDVTLHVSGPVDKLNVTYRSDPPLQFADIIALLATGRAPDDVAAVMPTSQSTGPQSLQQAGASAILSQALANPLAGRLQRLFGVSRLKIDPSITGVTTNNAAARVTLEQQISRNIMFTYITDVSRPQAQAIRVELDLTRAWSAVAQREENGIFGLDFLYKKQFK